MPSKKEFSDSEEEWQDDVHDNESLQEEVDLEHPDKKQKIEEKEPRMSKQEQRELLEKRRGLE